ncbi:MAG: gliding motility-associated C-terminal domain-containing protein, partial [Candidatus Poribacteria bacterium]
DESPAWSPDGTKIAFQSNRHGNWDIFLINIDGSQEEQLTNSVANEIKPKWSPDGKRMLFISDNSEFRSQGEILALEIHNREITTLSPAGIDAQHADWSPDMKSMVYQADNTIYITDFNFPPPQIEAVITRPYEGEYISPGQPQDSSELGGKAGRMDSWVDIIGIARGTNFKEYRLEYAAVDSASKPQIPNSGPWMPIGGISTSQAPQVGFLGRLDTRGLQGEYILKLSVVGRNGEIAVDDVSFFVENEPPRLIISEPPDGLITDNPLVVISGETEADVQVTINDEPVKLQLKSQTARFDTSLLLEEGDNIITIVARRMEFGIKKTDSKSGLETVVQRHVFLDTQGITINVDDPKDFDVVDVPYVTVKGNVSQTAKVVKILETTVIAPEMQPYIAADYQTSPIKNFQRTILLHKGMNVISIEAIDQLNRIARIRRRVIYEKPAVIRRDANPPGITNIIPPDGAVVADARPEISAILVDDVKIDPETIMLTFDGKEIDGGKFDFDERDGKFSYITEESFLEDGEHTFTIGVQDTSDNSARESVQFFIDTEPLDIAISAKVDMKDNSRLKVILTSNKPLQSIPLATIIVRSSAIYCALTNGDESPYYKQSDCLGYSINLNQVVTGKAPPFNFEALFDATPLQNSFIFDAAVVDTFGEKHTVHGYYARGELSEGIVSSWGQMKIEMDLHPSETTQKMESEIGISEVNRIGISGIAEAIFPVTMLKPVHGIVLRSQDGLDLGRLKAQRQNAEDRGLEPIDIVHVVEAGQKSEEATFILKLSIPKESPNSEFQFALFHWDARLQRWQAMDAIRDFSDGWIQATANEFGAYALLADKTPPTIVNLRPKDHQEVPLDRFLVEAEVSDDGSGIDRGSIKLLIDDRPAEFTYEPAHNRITYLPSNLKEGLHTLKLSVRDRASNIQTISSTFFTREVFDFAEEVIAYPNPAKNEDVVTIRFKLTRTADVTLKIYNVAGEIIYTEERKNAIGRINEWFAWDGKNQAKLPVASGVYIYILEAESSAGQKVRRSGKIAVVK